jgi:hypothetical protein
MHNKKYYSIKKFNCLVMVTTCTCMFMGAKLPKVGEVQKALNQKKNDSKPSEVVDFISKFVIIIKNINLEFRIY